MHVKHLALSHLPLQRPEINAPVFLVLLLLQVENTRHVLHVPQAVDVRLSGGLRAHDQVGEDLVVVCAEEEVKVGIEEGKVSCCYP